MNRHITMLIAHPDDEVIFLWWALQQTKKIICCSSDLNNPDRQWCKNRKKALQEIGTLVGAEVTCLDYNSEFYRASSRDGALMRMTDEVMALLQNSEVIFTHNSIGEYGHIDHILVHQIALMSGKRIITSDITINAGWMNVKKIAVRNENFIAQYRNDLEFYNKCKDIYLKYNSWTWSKPPIMDTRIYAYN